MPAKISDEKIQMVLKELLELDDFVLQSTLKKPAVGTAELSRILGKLVKDGLVVTQENEADGSIRYKITDAGALLLNESSDHAAAVENNPWDTATKGLCHRCNTEKEKTLRLPDPKMVKLYPDREALFHRGIWCDECYTNRYNEKE